MSGFEHGIEINYFVNDYNVTNAASCFDIPIAIAAGRKSEAIYLQYIVSVVTNNCWGDPNISWFESRREILSKLGQSFERHVITNFKDFRKHIYESIDNNRIIILPVTYTSLFYWSNYHNDSDNTDHAVVITGYKKECESFTIGDCNISANGLEKPAGGYYFCEIVVTDIMLRDIWEYSTLKRSEFNDSAFESYTVSEIKANDLSPIGTILAMQKTYEYGYNKLSEKILNNTSLSADQVDLFSILIKRDLCGHMKVVFDFIKSLTEENSGKRYKIINFEEYYMHERELVVSKWLKCMLKNNNVSSKAAEQLAKKARDLDCEFFNFIKLAFQ